MWSRYSWPLSTCRLTSSNRRSTAHKSGEPARHLTTRPDFSNEAGYGRTRTHFCLPLIRTQRQSRLLALPIASFIGNKVVICISSSPRTFSPLWLKVVSSATLSSRAESHRTKNFFSKADAWSANQKTYTHCSELHCSWTGPKNTAIYFTLSNKASSSTIGHKYNRSIKRFKLNVTVDSSQGNSTYA